MNSIISKLLRQLWRPEIKYLLSALTVVVLFSHFIACGAQMYKVSMKDDHTTTTGGAATESRDPNAKFYAVHATGGWTKLPISYYLESDMSNAQISGIKNAMATWELAVGKQLFNFVELDKQTGDAFPNLMSSLEGSKTGLYLNYQWKAKTSKPSEVLATTVWSYSETDGTKIEKSGMRYNMSDYMLCNAKSLDGCVKKGNDPNGQPNNYKTVADHETVSLHELGHMLGLGHVDDPVDNKSIMLAAIYIGEGLSQRWLSAGDIARIRTVYDCAGTCPNPDALSAQMASVGTKLVN